MKNPIDLSTIKRKLDTGQYQEPWQYVDDVWLMFNNAWLYNRKTSRVYKYCTKLAEVFEAEIDPVMQGLGYCCGRKVRKLESVKYKTPTRINVFSHLVLCTWKSRVTMKLIINSCLFFPPTVRVLTPNSVLLWQATVYNIQGWYLLQLPEQVKTYTNSIYIIKCFYLLYLCISGIKSDQKSFNSQDPGQWLVFKSALKSQILTGQICHQSSPCWMQSFIAF